jgi:hypothetical protein
MATLPTVVVSRNGARLIINQSDYNPETDALWSDSPTPKAKPPAPPILADGIPPALALINGKDVVRDVAIIPTLGQAAATRILENRPDGGYLSLDHVWEMNPEVLGGRFKVDTDVVAAWGG